MAKDLFTKAWIIQNAKEVCSRYDYGVLTLRALHYQLVGLGMTNDVQHYKRVVTSMISARWDGIIAFEQFSDLDREMVGETRREITLLEDKVDEGKQQVEATMNMKRDGDKARLFGHFRLEEEILHIPTPILKAEQNPYYTPPPKRNIDEDG